MAASQTRNPQRLATLLLIGALACYALWLIGLASHLRFIKPVAHKKYIILLTTDHY